MDTDPVTVAQVVREDIERVTTIHKVAQGTGIPYTTLNRRLSRGDFKVPELLAVAQFLRSNPADYLRKPKRLV